MNDLPLLLRLLGWLENAGLTVYLFGGWAEELLGSAPPRPHHDIDLLYPADDFSALERLLEHTGLPQITAKRFSHKRAFLYDGVLVEILLVMRQGASLETDFFSGQYRFCWPADTLTGRVVLTGRVLPAASAAALAVYRQAHAQVEQAYRAFHSRPG